MKATVTAAAAGMIDVGGDLTAARLGYGAMRITGPGVWGEPPDRDRARAALRRPVDLGVTFIDTADAYGPEVRLAGAAWPGCGSTGSTCTSFSEDQLREAERVTPVVSVQNVAAAGLELRPDEVTAVTSRPDAGILGLPRGLARNRRARTPRLPAAARPEHRSMSTE